MRRLLAVALALSAAAGTAAAALPSAGTPAAAPARLSLQVGRCRLEAPPAAARALTALSLRVPLVVARLEGDLGVAPVGAFRVVLIPPGPIRDADLARLDAGAPSWAAGYAIPSQRVVGIRLAEARRYPYGTPESVLAHETAHLALHDAVGGRLPLWFEEGVCTWSARSWQLEDLMIVSAQFLADDLPRLDRLEPEFRASAAAAEQAYAASFAFVSWSSRRYGQGFLRDVLARARTRPFALAWQAAGGESLERSELMWRRQGLVRFRWVPILTASGLLWLIILLLAFVVWWRKRSRVARLRESWAREEVEPWYGQAEEDEGRRGSPGGGVPDDAAASGGTGADGGAPGPATATGRGGSWTYWDGGTGGERIGGGGEPPGHE